VALEAWLREKSAGAVRCTGESSFDPGNKCYWGFRSNRPAASGAVAFCDLASGTLASGPDQRYLFRGDPLTAKTTASPDPNAHFAIDMAPAMFEKLDIGITLDASGVLTDFKVSATNLAAETAQAILSTELMPASLLSLSAGTGTDPLQDLVDELAKAEARRKGAFAHPNPGAELAAIDADIVRLRQLAEGRVDEKPFKVSLDTDPNDPMLSKDKTLQQKVAESDAKNLLGCGAPKCADGKSCDACGKCPSMVFRTLLSSSAASTTAAKTAEMHGLQSGSLRYRVPVRATAGVSVLCERMSIETSSTGEPATPDCAKLKPAVDGKPAELVGTAVPVQGDLLIPQWGPVLALPRSLGWRAGSISAKLDPNTGALLTLSAKNDDSLAAGLVNDAHKAALAREKAANVDEERLAVERESAILQNRVKICAARRDLGLPLGPDCPAH
jgi:hypothetical protein